MNSTGFCRLLSNGLSKNDDALIFQHAAYVVTGTNIGDLIGSEKPERKQKDFKQKYINCVNTYTDLNEPRNNDY